MKAIVFALLILSVAVNAETKLDWSGTWKPTNMSNVDKCCYPTSGVKFTGKEVSGEEAVKALANKAGVSADVGKLKDALGGLGGATISIKAGFETNFLGLGSALGGVMSAVGLNAQLANMTGTWDSSEPCKKIKADGKTFLATAVGTTVPLINIAILAGSFDNQGDLKTTISIANTVSENKKIRVDWTPLPTYEGGVACGCDFEKTGMSTIVIIIIVLVVIAILAVVGFLLYKRSQANKLNSNLAYTRA